MDESPVEAIRTKPDSSINVMCKLAAKGEADVVISAGNTGACVAAAQLRMRTAAGRQPAGHRRHVCRPFTARSSSAMSAPTPSQSPSTWSNTPSWPAPTPRPSAARKEPRVGLLTIGEEDAKGNTLTKEARKMMRDEPLINFIGNVEGRDLFKGVVDVVVCDGFVGNIVLKFTEGMAEGLFQTIVAELQEAAPELVEQFKPVMKKIYADARLAGIRRRAAAGRRRLLPDLPRPLRGPRDQERHPRRQAAYRQRDQRENR